MKPVCIVLINSGSFILYNKELNSLFNELESELIDSETDLIYLPDDRIIPQLEKVLPRGLGISAISREDLILLAEGPNGFQLQSLKFFIYYNDDFKKYTIKLL